MDKAWFQSRYDKPGPAGTGADYINCPLTKDQYTAFVEALVAADRSEPHALAEEIRGHTLFQWLPASRSHGGAWPRDLAAWADETVRPDQSACGRAEALCRRATASGQCARHALQYGRFSDQAETSRAGRNFPHHPRARKRPFRAPRRGASQYISKLAQIARWRICGSRPHPRLRFAGQITGCEGYVESAAIGLAAGRMAAAERKGEAFPPFPPTTALGALINHITGGHIAIIDAGPPSFQPMNVNFGLFPPLAGPPHGDKPTGRGQGAWRAKPPSACARRKIWMPG